MPGLIISTNSDAEVFVMDASLTRIARAVGGFSGELEPGLYKVKVNRAGTLSEQVIELGREARKIDMFIARFSAIAPIGPALSESDRGSIEDLGRAALDGATGPVILILAHQPADRARTSAPFRGARIFPWGRTELAQTLDGAQTRSRKIGDELWAAATIEVQPGDDCFVLELRNGRRVSRQTVIVADNWQTRVFMRSVPVGHATGGDQRAGGPFEVSIQMTPIEFPIVYDDHWQTVEVARTALEKHRAIFSGRHLIDLLLHHKFDNPIAGLTGLHLFLDAKVRWDTGDKAYDLGPATRVQDISDEVLGNLTRLLYPRRAKMFDESGYSSDHPRSLIYPDPQWPEAADLTALRLRAGRVHDQVFVRSPPMFRASWNILKENAGRGKLTWIGRALWRVTGDAGALGPYLAWAPGRHSVQRTLTMIKQNNVTRQEKRENFSGILESIGASPSELTGSTIEELAATYGLPLSIFQHAP